MILELDDLVEGLELPEVAQHLAECEDCSFMYAVLEQHRNDLREMEPFAPLEVPASVRERVAELMERRRAGRPTSTARLLTALKDFFVTVPAERAVWLFSKFRQKVEDVALGVFESLPGFLPELVAAAAGEGFGREKKSSPSGDVVLDVVQAGGELTFFLSTRSLETKDCFVRLQLMAEGRPVFSTVVVVTDGKGKYTLRLDRLPLPPSKVEPVVSIIPGGDIYTPISMDEIVAGLGELLSSDDERVALASAGLLLAFDDEDARETLRMTAEHVSDEVRQFIRDGLGEDKGE
jgi:hypothetical protein